MALMQRTFRGWRRRPWWFWRALERRRSVQVSGEPDYELREDGGKELREDGGRELREA